MNCPRRGAPALPLLFLALPLVLLVLAGCDDGSAEPAADTGADTVGDVSADTTDTTADTTPPDPCAAISNSCVTAGLACDGDATLVACSPDTNGCLVETRLACEGDALCRDGACVADPCAAIPTPCDAPSRACDGDTLVVCASNANGCLVERRETCLDTSGATCATSASGQAACTGDCSAVTRPCAAPGRACAASDPSQPAVLDQLLVCDYDARGCLVESDIPCEAGYSCETTSAGQVRCTEPCVDAPGCTSELEARCNGATIETCSDIDADGCLELVVTHCGGSSTCAEQSAGPVCDVPPETVPGTATLFASASEGFVALVDRGPITIQQGFQGGWMFVLSLRTRGMFSGRLSLSASAEVEGLAMASMQLEDLELTDGGDGWFYMTSAWLDLMLYEQPMLGTPVRLTLEVTDDLGATWSETLELSVGDYAYP